MCSNQGAGRGRFRGSLSPDHCLTTPDSLAGEREGGVGGGMIMEFSHSFLSTGPLVSTTLCWRMETLSIKRAKHSSQKVLLCFFNILALPSIFDIERGVVRDFGDFPVLGSARFILLPGVWLTADKRHNNAPSPPNLSLDIFFTLAWGWGTWQKVSFHYREFLPSEINSFHTFTRACMIPKRPLRCIFQLT